MQRNNFAGPRWIAQIRQRFANASGDPFSGRRIYLENAGGTLKLKSIFSRLERLTAAAGQRRP